MSRSKELLHNLEREISQSELTEREQILADNEAQFLAFMPFTKKPMGERNNNVTKQQHGATEPRE